MVRLVLDRGSGGKVYSISALLVLLFLSCADETVNYHSHCFFDKEILLSFLSRISASLRTLSYAWVTHSRMSIPDDYGFNPEAIVVNRNNP